MEDIATDILFTTGSRMRARRSFEDTNDEQDGPVAGRGSSRCDVWRHALARDAVTATNNPRLGFSRSGRRQLEGCRANCCLESGRR